MWETSARAESPAPGHAPEHHPSQGAAQVQKAAPWAGEGPGQGSEFPAAHQKRQKLDSGEIHLCNFSPFKYSQVTKLPLGIKPRMKTSIN